VLDRAQAEDRDLTGDEIAEIERATSDVAALTERVAELEYHDLRARNAAKAPTFMRRLDDPTTVDPRSLDDSQVRAAAVTMVERNEDRFVARAHAEEVVRKIEHGQARGATARLALATSSSVYARAWSKYVCGNALELTDQERQALAGARDVPQPSDVAWSGDGRAMHDVERAMTSGTGSSGGYFVPVFIDPTMVITGAGAANPMRRLSTVKQIGPAFGGWYGVTAAQVTAVWTAEGSAAPDNTPTLTQPNIPIYMAEAFAAASYQAFEDIADLASDLVELFQDAKDVLEATAHQTGDGSSKPKGIMTAVSAITASRVAATTAGTLGLVDVFALHSALPARFWNKQTRAWGAHVLVFDKIRQLAMAQNSANSVWTDMANNPSQLIDSPAAYASSLSSSLTTGQDVLLYGDYSRYFIIDRVGFSVEFIPNLFDTSTGRPTAQRGWFAHWRTGADCVDTNAFRDLRL
jgi:HK97 family phage major capsid protein